MSPIVPRVPSSVRPPGPDATSAVPNALAYRRNPLAFLTRCVRDYGDFVSLRLAEVPAYVVSHPDHIEHVLVRGGVNYVKDRFSQRYRKLLSNALVSDEDERSWRPQRRRLLSMFGAAMHADPCIDALVGCADRAASTWDDGSEPDVYRSMLDLTLDIMLRVLFDATGERDLGEVRRHAWQALRYLRAGMERPHRSAQEAPDTWGREVSGFAAEMRRLRQLVDNLVAKRLRAPGGADLLGQSVNGATRSEMSRDRLRDELISLLVSSHETTSLALSYTWYLLAREPGVQQALRRELREVLGDRPPGMADLPRLVFTERLVKESLRLYPPVWVLTREAVGDDVIDGFRVEAGSLILIPRWIVQRDPRFFAAPEECRPQRWAAGGEPPRPRLAYFPFGAGARACIGSNFAMVELVLLVAAIARRVRFSLPPGHRLDLLPSIHLRPRNGLQLRVSVRSAPPG